MLKTVTIAVVCAALVAAAAQFMLPEAAPTSERVGFGVACVLIAGAIAAVAGRK
jgi:hypothetical protein